MFHIQSFPRYFGHFSLHVSLWILPEALRGKSFPKPSHCQGSPKPVHRLPYNLLHRLFHMFACRFSPKACLADSPINSEALRNAKIGRSLLKSSHCQGSPKLFPVNATLMSSLYAPPNICLQTLPQILPCRSRLKLCLADPSRNAPFAIQTLPSRSLPNASYCTNSYSSCAFPGFWGSCKASQPSALQIMPQASTWHRARWSARIVPEIVPE